MADSMVSLAAIPSLQTQALTAEDFDELVFRNQKRILRLLMSLLRDEDAADTLTQECFLRAYKKRDSFRGESSVDTWLFRIAVNLARDYQRNKRHGFWKRLFADTRENEDGEQQSAAVETVPDIRATAETQLLAREEVQTVWRTVKRLSQNQREVFVLRFAEDMSLEEIAGTLEMELGTVKSHLSRALATVRTRLEEHRSGTR
ncbi:MAG TPA: sigma-70 family RNA polymerase sigma factor [Terriglobales bacterium]|nr:sigma-70 family RNA polymerase sigma factor [Terriglobales bacterium]